MYRFCLSFSKTVSYHDLLFQIPINDLYSSFIPDVQFNFRAATNYYFQGEQSKTQKISDKEMQQILIFEKLCLKNHLNDCRNSCQFIFYQPIDQQTDFFSSVLFSNILNVCVWLIVSIICVISFFCCIYFLLLIIMDPTSNSQHF